MEFASPDRNSAWAVVIRLAGATGEAYLLKPKGLNEKAAYRVTFDNAGKSEIIPGTKLAQEGLLIRPPAEARSELLLLRAL